MNAEVQCPNAQAQPQVRGGVVAYLLVDGASKASEFYQRAFGCDRSRAPAGRREGPDHARPSVRQRQLAHAVRSLSRNTATHWRSRRRST